MSNACLCVSTLYEHSGNEGFHENARVFNVLINATRMSHMHIFLLCKLIYIH